MQIKIADIVFGISSDQSIKSLGLENTYGDFFYNGVSPEIKIQCYHSGLPGISFRIEDKVFDSGTFWDVYKINSMIVFVLKTSVQGLSPYCVTIFNTKLKHIDIYNRASYNQETFNNLLPYLHPLSFPLFHLLMISLLAQGYGVLAHACGIDDGGKGFLFPGSSTQGKTTMARLWRDKATILNDERVILRQQEGRLWIYGTPWHGEYDSFSPGGVPLEKIFFLNHAKSNSACSRKNITAASELISHCFQPYWDAEGMRFTIDFCARVAADIPCYELDFVPKEDIVDFVRGVN